MSMPITEIRAEVLARVVHLIELNPRWESLGSTPRTRRAAVLHWLGYLELLDEARAVLAETIGACDQPEDVQDDLATLTIAGYPDKFFSDAATEQGEWVNDCLRMGKRYDPDFDKPIIQRGPEAQFPAGLIRSPDEVKTCVKCGCELKRGRDNMHLKAAPGGWLPYCFPCAPE